VEFLNRTPWGSTRLLSDFACDSTIAYRPFCVWPDEGFPSMIRYLGGLDTSNNLLPERDSRSVHAHPKRPLWTPSLDICLFPSANLVFQVEDKEQIMHKRLCERHKSRLRGYSVNCS